MSELRYIAQTELSFLSVCEITINSEITHYYLQLRQLHDNSFQPLVEVRLLSLVVSSHPFCDHSHMYSWTQIFELRLSTGLPQFFFLTPDSDWAQILTHIYLIIFSSDTCSLLAQSYLIYLTSDKDSHVAHVYLNKHISDINSGKGHIYLTNSNSETHVQLWIQNLSHECVKKINISAIEDHLN